jgi:hypothetical protein
MFKFTHSAARTIATAALFGSVVLYGPFAIAAGVFAGSASSPIWLCTGDSDASLRVASNDGTSAGTGDR